jgi:mannose-P-dolichol utilization defect protein 1
LGLVAGGAILKLPQIIKMVNAGSAAGISFSSYFLETISFTISLIYNVRNANPFTTYGEQLFITIQNVVILGLILYYNRQLPQLVVILSAYFVAALLLYSSVPMSYLPLIQSSTILIGIASRLPQLYTNYTNKSTGQLSIVTVALQALGSVARTFTTWKEVDDAVLLIGAVVAMVLNVAVAGQFVQYGQGSAPEGTLPTKATASKPRSKKVQ